MSFGPKSRTHRINYAKIIERAHRPHPDMRIFSPNEVPADPRAAKVLRVNPYRETTYLHSNRLPLGELVAPEVPPGVAQPARDNVMERPVYVPPKRGYVRGQA